LFSAFVFPHIEHFSSFLYKHTISSAVVSASLTNLLIFVSSLLESTLISNGLLHIKQVICPLSPFLPKTDKS
jgi:hypothetical protein